MSHRSNSIYIIKIFLFFQLLGLVVVHQGITEEHNTTLSGRIANPIGEPIADATVILLYFKKFNEEATIYPLYDSKLYPFLVQIPMFFNRGTFPNKLHKNALSPYLESKTDIDGKFSFANVASELVQLMVLPTDSLDKYKTPDDSGRIKHMPLPRIHSVQIDDVTFFPQQNHHFPPVGAVTFTMKPGRKIENVELKVSMDNPFNIRGRILYKNGAPLSDTSLTIKFGHLNFHYADKFPYRAIVPIKTDENGYFEHNVYGTGIYACSVDYRGLSAVSEPFLLNGETPHEAIVLTLDGNPDALNDLPSENTNTQQDSNGYFPYLSGVWILNPDNGHIYKRIVCKSREDAQTQASQEDAYLVAITSEKEQIWLESVFGTSDYWIGLTGHRNTNNWHWDTGEKIRYKNWKKDDSHRSPPAILRLFDWLEKKPIRKNLDYAIMTQDENAYMKWKVVDQGDSERGYYRIAVIEKPHKMK